MKLRTVLVLAVLIVGSLFAGVAGAGTSDAAGEYSKHFGALTRLSIAVAQAMPALPNTTDKDAIVKFLSDSFAYCAAELSASEWHQATELHGVKKSAAEEGSAVNCA